MNKMKFYIKLSIVLIVILLLSINMSVMAQHLQCVTRYHGGTTGWNTGCVGYLQQGDWIDITVQGHLNIWPECPWQKYDLGIPDWDCDIMRTDGSGAEGLPPSPESPFSTGNTAALWGQIVDADTGEVVQSFYVGTGTSFLFPVTGRYIIRFRINEPDWGLTNDIGSLVIKIEVNKDNP